MTRLALPLTLAERQRAEKAEAEKKTYESGWLEAEGIISDLQERVERAEAERDRLRESAASLCVSIEKQKSYGLPAISPQTAIALRDIRAALRQDEGDDE